MGKILRFIIAFLLVLIGILILVDGATGHSIWKHITKDTGSIVLQNGNIVKYEDGDKYHAGNGSVDAKGIRNMEINWISGEIILEENKSSNQISFEEKNSSATKEEDKLHWYQKGDTLYLQWCRNGIHSYSKNKDLSIRFPEGLKLDSLHINAVSADVTAKGLNAKDITTSTVSGKVRLRDVIFTTLDANSVSGDYLLEVLNRPSSIDFKGVSGRMDLKLPKDTGFTIDMATISGDIRTKVPTTGDKKHQTAGDGEVRITFESVSGDAEISY